jgi:hypothetical protein
MTWLTDQDDDERARLTALLDDPAGADASELAGDDLDYACWLAAVDELCRDRHGVSVFELGELSLAGLYQDELTPAEALAESLIDDGLGR